MKKFNIPVALGFLFCLAFYLNGCTGGKASKSAAPLLLGQLATGAEVWAKKGVDNTWGLEINGAGLSSLAQPRPVQIELYQDSSNINRQSAGYQSISKEGNGYTASAEVKAGQSSFHVEDRWTIEGGVLRLARKVRVQGNSPGAGFLSAVTFNLQQPQTRNNLNYFVPGMIYGTTDFITDVAIGGSKGGNTTVIREDRLPAPLFGVQAKDGTSFTLLNPAPQGHTTKEDSHDRKANTMIDRRFRFGALGVKESAGGGKEFGYWWPGTEGETTYQGYFYPGGQLKKWRRRYHPVENGLTQQYQVAFRFQKDQKEFSDFYPSAWRWAWQVLNPQVNPQDIELARRSLIDMLAQRVETQNGITGPPNSVSATSIEKRADTKTVMGFTGKALETANFLLQDADRGKSPLDQQHRQTALDIINTFLKLKLNAPEGEGFYMDSGKPALALPRQERVYLRSFGDDLKSLLKAAKREKAQGREYKHWVAWARTFADWLLPQQTAAGGFPRTWAPVTGKVVDASPQSSYTVIPYLLLLTELTGDTKYKEAALRAGDAVWNNGQYRGLFVGGTIDNPDVIDKEAGTLSLEAHLALYAATKDQKWLDRAKAAADFSETWVYIWNVPMPEDERLEDLHWKPGVPTVGLQLISTGHSLVDAYMAFDADEFARLSVLTQDPHYLEVASILLHNTKGMLALPGRTYDLPGPGWQQEHWSLAPERGLGRKRAWLPWVSTSHLNGIFGLEENDPELYRKLTQEVKVGVKK